MCGKWHVCSEALEAVHPVSTPKDLSPEQIHQDTVSMWDSSPVGLFPCQAWLVKAQPAGSKERHPYWTTGLDVESCKVLLSGRVTLEAVEKPRGSCC